MALASQLYPNKTVWVALEFHFDSFTNDQYISIMKLFKNSEKSENSKYKQLLIIPNFPAKQVDCSLDSSSQTAVSLSTPVPQSLQQRIRQYPKPTKPKLQHKLYPEKSKLKTLAKKV